MRAIPLATYVPIERNGVVTGRDFKPRTRDWILVVGVGLIEVICLVAFTLALRWVIDSLTPTTVGAAYEQSFRRSLVMVAIMAGLALLMGLLRTLEFGLAEAAGYEAVRRLRMKMYSHLLGMTPDQLRHRARGGLLLRLTGDLSMLRMWLSRGLLTGTVALLELVVGIGLVAWLNPWIALAMVLGLSITALLSLTQGRSMRRATKVMRRRRSLLIGSIDEQINSLAVVQVGARTGGEYARLARQNDSLTESLNAVAWLRGRLRGLAYMGSTLVSALVLAVGVIEVHAGATTIGATVAALLISRFMSRPIRTLGLAHDYWHRAQVSRQKIMEFHASSSRGTERGEQPRLRVRRGAIQLRDVSSGVLVDVNMDVPAGRVVALTGPSRSGKSTLLQVVAGLQDPTQGEVWIDDQPLSSTSPESLFRQIGVVSPDLPLMRGTIHRNLTYDQPDVNDGQLHRVCLALGVDQMLLRHPDGMETWLTEGGANLSLSERQLLKIARALIPNPPILLLDEPTVWLDDDSKARFLAYLRRQQSTVLLVTHDPDVIADADETWHLAAGQQPRRIAPVWTKEISA